MITFGRSYIVDGAAFASLQDAQRHALAKVFHTEPDAGFIISLVASADDVVNILTTKGSSLPRARKANGGTKRRPAAQAKTEAAA